MRFFPVRRGGLIVAFGLLGGAAALTAACGHDYGAAELPAEAGPESGIEDASVDASTTDVASDVPDVDAGPAVDAGPPCPYDGGCPCSQPACMPTKLGSYAFDETIGFANDSATLYVGAGTSGLNAISLVDGGVAAIYTPADATTKVTNIALSNSDIFVVEIPNATDPNIVAVARAVGHAPRVVASQVHMNGMVSNDLIAVNDTRVYWNQVQPFTVKAALHDGGDVRSTAASADELVATAGGVYLSSSSNIYRYSTDLSAQEAVTGPINQGLVADGASVFWRNGTFLYGAPAAFVDNAGAAVASGPFIVEIVFGDDGFLYFHDLDSLFRCRRPNCDGGSANLGLIPSNGRVVAIAGGNAYVMTDGVAGVFDIQRMPLHD